MNVTAEQWAQPEVERQRHEDMVQTVSNEVRRLGTEQNNNLQEIQRLRATVPPVETSDGADVCTTTDNSCRTRNHRHENWEAACGRRSTATAAIKVRVVDH